ncbi:hypothetical protein SNEBB_003367 [Seison nebaliae]|nr:hypothetical protein SNEBB_003367 [Seison nebaliae]
MRENAQLRLTNIDNDYPDEVTRNPSVPKYWDEKNFNIGVEMLNMFVKTQNATFTFGCENNELTKYKHCKLEKDTQYFIICDDLAKTEIGSSSLEYYWNEDSICLDFDQEKERTIFVDL